jgi:uncharacterized membrane protein YphA (DoxX/SURF4 family)
LNLLQIYRFTIALSWIYHGVFPKLLAIAPMEKAITATMGFDEKSSMLITFAAGIGEVIFGIVLFTFYRNTVLIKLNIAALIGLLLYVAIFIPVYLVEAFNPVTTNISLIIISLSLMSELDKARSPYNNTP